MKVSGNTHIISRVYVVIMYVLGGLSDMRHLLGNREVTTGRQVGEVNNRKGLFFFTRKFHPILICLYLPQNLRFVGFMFISL